MSTFLSENVVYYIPKTRTEYFKQVELHNKFTIKDEVRKAIPEIEKTILSMYKQKGLIGYQTVYQPQLRDTELNILVSNEIRKTLVEMGFEVNRNGISTIVINLKD